MSDKYYRNDNIPSYNGDGDDMDGYYDQSTSPVSKRHDKKTGCLGGLLYFIFIVSVSVILACVGWMAASDVLALNKEVKTVDVTLPEEIFTQEKVETTSSDGTVRTSTVNIADIGKVAKILKDSGIIEYKPLFEFYSKISDAKEKMDPGTYTLSTEYDYRAIVKKMQFGSDSQVRTMVTFPEGFTMQEIFKRLEENKICKYEDLMDCAANTEFNYKFLEDIPLGDASRLEGFLFPDTYEFYEGETPEATIDTFLQIFHYKLTAEMWDIAAAKNLSMRDIVNIASMIEKEAANDDERATISSVIYNRLKANMPLGIDATIQYALPEHKEQLTQEDLDIDSPYNTRKNTGLPPTPIANPGFPSITAALKPATTNYLYYALDTATKTHKFFKTASEFNAFVATQSY
ncbi:MAG: endolytic transglycosylase MltG [Oscillospiraceae bacterium]|nr:endolytic transglycosylase MltG [Oscillospiraceae bacterium]